MGNSARSFVDASATAPNHEHWRFSERDPPMRITAAACLHHDADKPVNGITHQRRPRLRPTSGSRQAVVLTFAGCLLLLTTGCHHKKQQAYAPAPPPIGSYPSRPGTGHGEANQNSAAINRPPPRGPVAQPEGKPSFVETGMASWYGPSGHRSADGSAYDGKGMTAAHKTLPLGTVARVTNLANGESVMVRITDRGPFSHGRVLDLSESAAKQIDLYRMGVAQVKIEAYANVAASPAGRWCVQTGAFKSEQDALALKSALARRYVGSRVIEFAGATGYWVRIDPVRHDHADAAAIMDWIGSPDPQAVPYIVRVN